MKYFTTVYKFVIETFSCNSFALIYGKNVTLSYKDYTMMRLTDESTTDKTHRTASSLRGMGHMH